MKTVTEREREKHCWREGPGELVLRANEMSLDPKGIGDVARWTWDARCQANWNANVTRKTIWRQHYDWHYNVIWPQERPETPHPPARRSLTDPSQNVLEPSIPSHMQILYTSFSFCQVMQVNLLATKIKNAENDCITMKNLIVKLMTIKLNNKRT